MERTADKIVSDLHELLHTVSVPQPDVVVGHSIGGIYVRKYAALYPEEVAALVLVDSAHEEQFARRLSLGPTLVQWTGAKVDNQVAAPTELSTPTLQRAGKSLLTDCGWKDGDRGGPAPTEETTGRKNKNVLTHTGLLMEGVTALKMA